MFYTKRELLYREEKIVKLLYRSGRHSNIPTKNELSKLEDKERLLKESYFVSEDGVYLEVMGKVVRADYNTVPCLKDLAELYSLIKDCPTHFHGYLLGVINALSDVRSALVKGGFMPANNYLYGVVLGRRIPNPFYVMEKRLSICSRCPDGVAYEDFLVLMDKVAEQRLDNG